MKSWPASLFTIINYLIFTFSASAQISIGDSDMPTTGETFRLSIAANPVLVDPGQGGTGQTWDFSDLTHADQRVDTFQTVSSTPAAYQIKFNNPTEPDYLADYALHQPTSPPVTLPNVQLEDLYEFYKNETGAFQQLGIGAKLNGIPFSARFDPIDTLYHFPLKMGNIDSSRSTLLVDLPNFGAYGQDRKRVTTVDGTGTLTTPYGSFQTLRVKTDLQISDTIYVDSLNSGTRSDRPDVTLYEWFAKGMGVPLLRIRETNGQVTRVEYQDSVRTPLSVRPEKNLTESAELRVRNKTLTIKAPNDLKLVRVIGPRGRTIYKERPSGKKLRVKLDGNPSGIYLVHWITDRGRMGAQKIHSGLLSGE